MLTSTYQAVLFAFCLFAGFHELLFNTGGCELNIVVLQTLVEPPQEGDAHWKGRWMELPVTART